MTKKIADQPTAKAADENLGDAFEALKSIIGNPEAKEMLKSMLFGDEKSEQKNTKTSTSNIGVYEVDESDIPEAEKHIIKNVKVKDGFSKQHRQEITMITKTCGCGRSQSVVARGPLDTYPFVCNKCLRG